MLDNEDVMMIELATSSASLDRSPKKNWVENAGELPPYIRKLARAIEKSGKTLSAAIAIAISRVKRWASGGDDVEADTRAKAAKALAQWEALKAKNKAKKVVKATNSEGQDYVFLTSVGSFNTDLVRRAWDNFERDRRRAARQNSDSIEDASEAVPYSYVRELWTDYIIIDQENGVLFKIPYEVSGNTVTFKEPVRVKQAFVETDGDNVTEYELALLSDVLKKPEGSSLERIMSLTARG